MGGRPTYEAQGAGAAKYVVAIGFIVDGALVGFPPQDDTAEFCASLGEAELAMSKMAAMLEREQQDLGRSVRRSETADSVMLEWMLDGYGRGRIVKIFEA